VFEDETQNPNSPERVDVVAVGAGLAGLVAARELLGAGLSVLVLEARERVGGRLLNHTLQNGAVVELGGQWVGPTQDRVLALAEELGVGLFPTYVQGEHILAVDGAVKRYGGDDFALPEDALADVVRAPLRFSVDPGALRVLVPEGPPTSRQVPPLEAGWHAARTLRRCARRQVCMTIAVVPTTIDDCLMPTRANTGERGRNYDLGSHFRWTQRVAQKGSSCFTVTEHSGARGPKAPVACSI
jgi:hypothetical protein